MNKVLYRFGLKADYLALKDGAGVDQFTLYWCTDTQELFKGDLLFAVGAEASEATAGLMSPEDKQKLDALSAGATNFKGVYDDIEKVEEPKPGDIVLVGTKEYIYTEQPVLDENGDPVLEGGGPKLDENGDPVLDENGEQVIEPATPVTEGKWVELGDEGIYLTEAKAQETYQTKEEAQTAVEALEAKLAVANAGNTYWEITQAVDGYLTSDAQNDLRLYIPAGSQYTLQQGGEGSDPTKFYATVKIWAPDVNIDSCRTTDADPNLIDAENLKTVHIDAASGRPYTYVYIPIATTADGGVTWTEYAKNSTANHYVGWTWVVNWYTGDALVSTSSRKITLVDNKTLLYNGKDWYAADVEKSIADIKAEQAVLSDATTWASII